ncbi:EcsC protein family protein [Planctomycetes bacterium Poly30]|uniref:EcsC protein family protein n=1 Tax=Saltatorellus ferox TaxID=2528018 RepID=A0A518EXD4_9BACT|nr:EcsC protein family protein [Planctomycetes bacterium Poly30]
MAKPDENAGADVALPADAVQEIVRAKLLLESPHLAARLADLLGGPIEALIGAVGDKNAARVHKLTQKALDQALSAALKTLNVSAAVAPSPRLHMAAASAAGAAGGAFGWAALAIELPISTSIILRSIADIARGEGERLDDPEVRMQCLSVLALGGTSHADDAAETGYFATRAALASAVSQAASYLASEAALASRSAPALVRLVAMIAERFGVQVSAKIAATAVPVIGAVTGGAINSIFMDHFQCIARGHFMIRRLERLWGTVAVRAEMEKQSG